MSTPDDSNDFNLVWVNKVWKEPTPEFLADNERRRENGQTPLRWQGWYAVTEDGENGRDLFQSTEFYTNEADLEKAIRKNFARGTSVYMRSSRREGHEHGNVLMRLASDIPLSDVRDVYGVDPDRKKPVQYPIIPDSAFENGGA